jgi:hypothetical protein
VTTQANTVPCTIGSFAPNATAISPAARPVSKITKLSRALLASVAQICLRVFVFAAIVLWPWESAW